jgi:tRNA A-37 threonylcarbamoyl transferase component Bud32
VRETFTDCFPKDEFGDYRDFVDSPGECLKAEPRTRITLLCRHVNGPGGGTLRKFILKTYRYPFFLRFRTAFHLAKAEREFNAFINLERLGIPAAEPVAFGVEKTLFGSVRSCFIVTAYVEETTNLSAHRKSDRRTRSEIGTQYGDVIMRQIGERLRRIHQARFFLLTMSSKNILLRRPSGQSVETLFIDLPYARTLRWRPLARWAQKRDIAVFLGSFLLHPMDLTHSPFYEAYLPDPLGGSDRELVHRVGKSVKARQNKTLMSLWSHRIKWFLRASARLRKTNQQTRTE